MFAELVGIANLLRSGVESFRKSAVKTGRGLVVERILKTYFVLKDTVDEGEGLLLEAGPRPIETLNALTPDAAAAMLKKWDEALARQRSRLLFLQDRLFGQDHLEIVDPELKEKLETAIGYKSDSVFTLHLLGASLFFKPMFAGDESKEATANYVLLLAGNMEDSDAIDTTKMSHDVHELRESLERYRVATEKLVSPEELALLAKRARDETTI